MKKNLRFVLFIALIGASTAICTGQENLFISEVCDPVDDYTGRFVELYNAGTEAIDMEAGNFYLSRQSNGGTSWGDLPLTGIVEAGTCYLIGGSEFENIFGFAPDIVTGILTGNGDDAYVLFSGGDHTTGTVHDIYGVIDEDGTDTPWEYLDSRALRLESINSANSTWTALEWEINSAAITDLDPGIHHSMELPDTLPEVRNIGVYIEDTTVAGGSVFYIAVSTDSLLLVDNIIAYQFSLSYDTLLMEYAGIETTGTLSEGGTVAQNAQDGILSVSFMTTLPLQGEGILLQLAFNPLQISTGSIQLQDLYLNNTLQEEARITNIEIVETEPPIGYLTLNDSLYRFMDSARLVVQCSENMMPGTPLLLNFTGAVYDTGIVMNRILDSLFTYDFLVPKNPGGTVNVTFAGGSDLYGNIIIAEPAGANSFFIHPFRKGDIDDDGMILAYDAALALQHSVGIDPIPLQDPLPWEAWRDSTANIDGINEITAYDAALILQYSAGILLSFDDSNTKASHIADIEIKMEKSELWIVSKGELLGLNLEIENASEILGVPVLLNESFLMESKYEDSNLKIGLCTHSAVTDGTRILDIPILKNSSTNIYISANNLERSQHMDLALKTEKHAIENCIYPNPAKDHFRIASTSDGHLFIYNSSGSLCKTAPLVKGENWVNISELKTGLYVLVMENGRKNEYAKLVVE